MQLVNYYRPSDVVGLGVCASLIVMGSLTAAYSGDVFTSRVLPASCVSSASNYATQLTVTVSNSTPSAFILTEVLPAGWSIVAATWNGSTYMPTKDGPTNKWVFGVQPPAGPGILSYTTTPTNAFERQYSISGQVKYLEGTSQIERETSGNLVLSSCDRDGDYMPDDWEIHYGLNPTNALDAAQDSDGDHVTNCQEYLADTNPTNALSRLRLLGVSVSTTQTVVRWQGGTAATQFLERSSSLASNVSWVCIYTNLPPTPLTNTFPDGLQSGNRFYRVRAVR